MGVRHGKGRYVGSDGYRYAGDWVDGKEQGQGECTSGRGWAWSGLALRGALVPHSTPTAAGTDSRPTGTATLANGTRYRGAFHAGLPQGQGKAVSPDGDRYDGEWQAGAQHGVGACTTRGGDMYFGQWQAGKRHGLGRCVFARGARFQGEWRQGTWVQGPAEPGLCVASGTGLTRAVAGLESSFSLVAHDAQFNHRLGGGDAFDAWLTLPESRDRVCDAAVVDHGDGSYTFTYTPSLAGEMELHIEGDGGVLAVAVEGGCGFTGSRHPFKPFNHPPPGPGGQPAGDGPHILLVTPGPPVARTSTVDVTAARAGAASATVWVRDAHGNLCALAAATAAVDATLHVSGAEADAVAKAAPDGSVLLTWTPPPRAVGPGFMEVAVGGVRVPGSPWAVAVGGPTATGPAAAPPEDAVARWGALADALAPDEEVQQEVTETEAERYARVSGGGTGRCVGARAAHRLPNPSIHALPWTFTFSGIPRRARG